MQENPNKLLPYRMTNVLRQYPVLYLAISYYVGRFLGTCD